MLGVALGLLYALLLLTGRTPLVFSLTEAHAAEKVAFSCAEVTYVPQSECEALVDLYNATGGPLWTVNDSWLTSQTDTPCNWLGVDCEFGHVVGLALRDKGLTGKVPGSVFARLPELIDLDLGRNDLSGPIPVEISDLDYLKRLALDNNQFYSPIPPGLLGHKPIPKISDYANTRPQLNLGDNVLTGTLPADLGIDLATMPLASFSVHNNILLEGPIPVAYAERIELFRWTLTSICVPRDIAVSTWLNIPQSAWETDTQMCPQEPGLVLDAAPGTLINGDVAAGPVTVEGDTVITCGAGADSCAEIRAKCRVGEWIVAEIVASDFMIKFKGFSFDDDTFDASTVEIDLATLIIMMVADPSPDLLNRICGEEAVVDVATKRQVDDRLTLEMTQGAIQLQAPSPTTTLQISTPHAVIENVGAATLEIAVAPDAATLMSVVAGAATMSPTGASGDPGTLPPLVPDTGRLITNAGDVYGFTLRRPLFVPFVRTDPGR